MKQRLYFFFLLLLFLSENVNLFSQITISGPTCVETGVIYRYKVQGTWDSASTMQVCISGGTIINNDSSQQVCTPQGGAPLGVVQVIWNQSGATALTATSTAGNSVLTVSLVSPLMPGAIDNSSQKQMIGYKSIPATIICSDASGGSCSPFYGYQWQQSPDRVSWSDITNATDKNLTIDAPMTETTFYRRRVGEKKSTTIDYSDIAAVFVIRDSLTANRSGANNPVSSLTNPNSAFLNPDNFQNYISIEIWSKDSLCKI